jgi:hypothetical protein
MEWAASKPSPPTPDAEALALAAAGGHVRAMQWLRERGSPLDEAACAAAASGGWLVALDWKTAPPHSAAGKPRTEGFD